MTKTEQNLWQAFSGESQAYTKYMYFSKLCREQGHHDIADHFEHTAKQELRHAWSHLELLIGKPDTKRCLEMAIEGETYEYTEMYPKFEEEAEQEQNEAMLLEARAQTLESREHAEEFQNLLDLAKLRFGALAKIENNHAKQFKQKEQQHAASLHSVWSQARP
jgi:rubrerythrin